MSYELEETDVIQGELVRPDLTIYYTHRLGRAGETPVVLVHGWAGSRSDWKPLENWLGAERGYLSYDAAGFGESQFYTKSHARAADFSIDRYTSDLKALLDQEGIKRACLVGHSWGGVIAMAFAACYPERVESLVAIGSAYFDPDNILHRSLKWASYLIAWVILLLKPFLKRFDGLRRLAVRRYFHRQPDRETAGELMDEVLSTDPQALIQTLLKGYDVRFKQVCPAIQCPTLYIGTDKDVVAPVPYVKAFVPLTPGSRYLEIDNCGHFPMLEQPGRLKQALAEFWSKPQK